MEKVLNLNAVDTIPSAMLGNCGQQSFNLDSDSLSVTLTHTGNDGWIGDWVRIFDKEDQFVECYLGGVILKESVNDGTQHAQFTANCSSAKSVKGKNLIMTIKTSLYINLVIFNIQIFVNLTGPTLLTATSVSRNLRV